jgi:competence protein ComEC
VDGWLLPTIAAGFWVGILLDDRMPAGLAAAAVCALAGLACLVLGARHPSRAVRSVRLLLATALVIGFVFLGAADASLRAVHLRASPLYRLAGRSVLVRGSLDGDPAPGSLGWTVPLNVERLEPSTPGWPVELRVHDPVWMEGRGPPPRMRAGDRVEVAGLLDRPAGDFGRYLMHRGDAAALSASTVRYLGPPSGPVVRFAEALRGALRSSLRRVFPPKEAGLMMGLTLGDTSQLDPGVEADFKATGLTHLLAVSGENLAMFLAPLLGLAVWLGTGRRTRLAVGLGGVVFFALLTRAEPSVLRASAMALLTLLGIFLGRPRTLPTTLGASVLVLIAMNPTLVYSIGFQLSVAATAGMALLATPIAERLGVLPRGLALAVGTTLSAQAGVTPVLLYYFGWVPSVTLVANVLADPAVGPGMLLGLLAAASGLVSGVAGLLVARLAALPLGYLEGLSAKRRVPAKVGLVAGLLVPLVVWSHAFAAGAPRELTVIFFDIGQGDAALIRSPAGAQILIDGGPDQTMVATKLAALGVHRLDLMVATHPHADHVAGLPVVLSRVPVGLVVDPGCAGSSPFYAAFLRAVRASGSPFRHPRPLAELRVADVRIDVLGPEHCWGGTASDPNNDSLVLLVRDVGGAPAVLFTGDAQQENQTDLLRDEAPFLRAPVLKVPHHGGATSLPDFLAATHARVAIVSVGPNRYGHPNPGLVAELRSDGMRVYRTDRSGDITVTFDRGRVEIRSAHD